MYIVNVVALVGVLLIGFMFMMNDTEFRVFRWIWKVLEILAAFLWMVVRVILVICAYIIGLILVICTSVFRH